MLYLRAAPAAYDAAITAAAKPAATHGAVDDSLLRGALGEAAMATRVNRDKPATLATASPALTESTRSNLVEAAK